MNADSLEDEIIDNSESRDNILLNYLPLLDLSEDQQLGNDESYFHNESSGSPPSLSL